LRELKSRSLLSNNSLRTFNISECSIDTQTVENKFKENDADHVNVVDEIWNPKSEEKANN
jgi:hypothetical protein